MCVCFLSLMLISPCRSFEQCESVNNEEFAVYFKAVRTSKQSRGFLSQNFLNFLACYKTASDSCIIIKSVLKYS